MPLLASQMGVKFFEERLAKMCITWLAGMCEALSY
jgi:hypothetical protein